MANIQAIHSVGLGDPDPYGATPADPAVMQRWRDWVAAGAAA